MVASRENLSVIPRVPEAIEERQEDSKCMDPGGWYMHMYVQVQMYVEGKPANEMQGGWARTCCLECVVASNVK